jgi:hypothetical protein
VPCSLDSGSISSLIKNLWEQYGRRKSREKKKKKEKKKNTKKQKKKKRGRRRSAGPGERRGG